MIDFSTFRVALLLSSVLAGCTTAPPMRVTPRTSAIALARDIRSHQSADGASPLSLLQSALPAPSSTGAFAEETLSWCANTKDRGNASFSVTVRFIELCGAKLGSLEEGACLVPGRTEGVLFLAKVNAERTCKEGNPMIEVQVIEPLTSTQSPAYLARLGQAGYPSPQEAAARQARQQAYRTAEGALVNKLVAAETERMAAELPVMRKRGTTVCRQQRATTYKGFVEDATDEKIKINVAFAFATSVPSMQLGGFQPHTIWDDPANWRLC